MSTQPFHLAQTARIPTSLPGPGVGRAPTARSAVQAAFPENALGKFGGAVDAAHFGVLFFCFPRGKVSMYVWGYGHG